MPASDRPLFSIRRVHSEAARLARPVRRIIMPRRFKETYVNEALSGRPTSVYVEIGVRGGASFRAARATRKIGVDPFRSVALDLLRSGEEFIR